MSAELEDMQELDGKESIIYPTKKDWELMSRTLNKQAERRRMAWDYYKLIGAESTLKYRQDAKLAFKAVDAFNAVADEEEK